MNTLSKHLQSSIQTTPVNESILLGGLVASACLAFSLKGFVETDFMKSIGEGIGNLLTGFAGMFGNIGAAKKRTPDEEALKELHSLLKRKPSDLTPKEKARLEELGNKYDVDGELSENELKKFNEVTGKGTTNDETEDDPKPKKDDEPKETVDNANVTSALLMLAKKANDNEKDETKKKENASMIKLLTACSFDENGEEIEFDKRLDRLKDIVPEEQFNALKDKLTKVYEENKDSDDFKKALEQAKKDITEKDVNQYISEAKEEAKKSWKEIKEQQAKQKELDDEIAKLEKELEDATGDDKKSIKDKLTTARQEQENTYSSSFVASVCTALGIDPPKPAKSDDTTGGKGDDDTTGGKGDDDTTGGKGDDDTTGGKGDDDTTGGKGDDDTTGGKGEPKKPEDYTDKEIESLQDELAGLDPENDKDKIKEKEDLLKSIAKAKGKGEEDYIPKTETGKDGKPLQKKVGPQGGKYYRTKGDKGWGSWQNYQTPSQLPESVQYSELSNHLMSIFS